MSYKPDPYLAYPPSAEAKPPSLVVNTDVQTVEDIGARTPSPHSGRVRLSEQCQEEEDYWAVGSRVFLSLIQYHIDQKTQEPFCPLQLYGLKPFTDWLHDETWLGPFVIIAAMIIVSFPPLLGHEILAVLCGVAFQFATGCLVDALGTVLGEVANYFVFKYACSARGRKLEEKNIEYGALAHVVRQGGFWIVLVMRYSAIPAHLATPIFSTVGVPFPVFLVAAILSVPKSFVPVYVGWAAKPENDGNTTAKIVSKVVLGVALCITIGALWWVNRKMKQAKEEFIYSRRKARQAKTKGPQAYINVPLNVAV
ncbi:hypothetical protein MVEN_02171200 [Mycena venus]|uniref:Golgi apparatus membrane protein TVP38 n=1 Tax=Mycena venus TaxID=2733690 RepID=A0A8H6X867_9AGAR|nr:hypothetical protein MVEN_02171200 [Mycena venus]